MARDYQKGLEAALKRALVRLEVAGAKPAASGAH